MAFSLVYKSKRLEIINIYRIPTSLSNMVYCSLSQYQLKDGKVRSTGEYRKEIFNEIKKYVNSNEDINDIIIARDFNQHIGANEIQHFFLKIGVNNIHY